MGGKETCHRLIYGLDAASYFEGVKGDPLLNETRPEPGLELQLKGGTRRIGIIQRWAPKLWTLQGAVSQWVGGSA